MKLITRLKTNPRASSGVHFQIVSTIDGLCGCVCACATAHATKKAASNAAPCEARSRSAGEPLARGQRYGFIRFGSRVDVYLPLGSRARVSIGEKVYASSTILAEL